jgi:endo-1,4-beta-D-glucanase Y
MYVIAINGMADTYTRAGFIDKNFYEFNSVFLHFLIFQFFYFTLPAPSLKRHPYTVYTYRYADTNKSYLPTAYTPLTHILSTYKHHV